MVGQKAVFWLPYSDSKLLKETWWGYQTASYHQLKQIKHWTVRPINTSYDFHIFPIHDYGKSKLSDCL
jgi:hypothetical protein